LQRSLWENQEDRLCQKNKARRTNTTPTPAYPTMTKTFFDPSVVSIVTVGTGVNSGPGAVVGVGSAVAGGGDGGIASAVVVIGVAVGRIVADGGVGVASATAVNVGVRGASVTAATGSVGVGVNVG